MYRKIIRRFGRVAAGVALCLMASACRTVCPCRDAHIPPRAVEKKAKPPTPIKTWTDDAGVQWSTRYYYIPPSVIVRSVTLDEQFWTRKFGTDAGNLDCCNIAEKSIQNVVKQFLSALGVGWPEGSFITYLPEVERFLVTNTLENQNLIKALLAPLCSPRQVETDMQIVAFQTRDVERLLLAGNMTKDALFELRKAGKAKLVATTSVVTKNGSEATMKAVQEVIYPTELAMAEASCDSNRVSRSDAVVPGNFTTREVGMILQLIPDIVADSELINLTLAPQWVTLDRWESYPADVASRGRHKTLPIRQPVFGVTSVVATCVTLACGETILIGSGPSLDGEWVHAAFLTARIQNVQPDE